MSIAVHAYRRMVVLALVTLLVLSGTGGAIAAPPIREVGLTTLEPTPTATAASISTPTPNPLQGVQTDPLLADEGSLRPKPSPRPYDNPEGQPEPTPTPTPEPTPEELTSTPEPTPVGPVRLDHPVLRWLPEIIAASQATGVPAELIAGMMQLESGGNPNIISPAGARGLMQIMPSNLVAMGIPEGAWHDPATNVMAGASFLVSRLGGGGSWADAVAAYFGYGCDVYGTCTDVYVSVVFGWANYYAPILADVGGSGFAILGANWVAPPIAPFVEAAPSPIPTPPPASPTPTPTATPTASATATPTPTPTPPTETPTVTPTPIPTTPPTEVPTPPTEIPTEVPTEVPTEPPPPVPEPPTAESG